MLPIVSVAPSSCALHRWNIRWECGPDSDQNTASARDRVRGLLRIDSYVGPIVPDAAQLDTEAEIAAEIGGPAPSFHEIPVNRNLKGGVLREQAAFEREESSHRMEGGVVRAGGGTVETAVGKQKVASRSASTARSHSVRG